MCISSIPRLPIAATRRRERMATGVSIPDPMRMQPKDLLESMSPLLFLLYDGEFRIE